MVPGSPIWNRCPSFHVCPTGCCIHPILYFKNVPPLLLHPGDGPGYTELRFCWELFSESSEPVIVIFSMISSWYHRCLWKTIRLDYSTRFGIFSWFCVLDLVHFPFNLKHTKTIEISMCENEQKPELESEPWKKEFRSRNQTHENQELRSWSRVHEKKSLRSRSCDILTTTLQPWNNPNCSRAHRQSRVKIQQINCFSNNLKRLS